MARNIDLNVVQKNTMQKTLIKTVALLGAVLGLSATILHLESGKPQFVLAWSIVFLLNLAALLLVNKKTDLAAKLFLTSIILPSVSVHIYQWGAGPGIYLAAPALAVCAAAMTSKRFAVWFAFLFTAALLVILTISQVYFYEQFSRQYALLETNFYLNVSMCLIFTVTIATGSMHALKKTYVSTQEELIKEKDSAQFLREEIARSLQEKSSVLNMALKMQEMGKVYGFVYYPETDALCSPRHGASSYVIGTLDEANEKYHSAMGVDSKVVDLIRIALSTKEDWDVEYQELNSQGEQSYLRTKGQLVFKGGGIDRIVIAVNDITENKVLTDQLSIKANVDDLTGILSRRRFEEIFESVYENSACNARSMYLFIDLDRFKIVNDTSGHAAGDCLLKEVCSILTGSVRDDDVVGRLGGDEFGIILHRCEYDVAIHIAELIRECIEAYRFSWRDIQHRIEASIGVVAIDPELGSIPEVQALADAACYRAKHKGRNRVESVLDDEDGYRSENTEKSRVNQIDNALDRGLLSLWYQDIVPAHQDKGHGVKREILIRLYEPLNDKWIMPAEFLSVAERYNRSIEIDKWVVTKLIETLEEQSVQCEVEYWVNLSAQSISDPRFAEFLYSTLANSELTPGTINFEITETSAVVSHDAAISMMDQIKQLGSKFALDDFGVGHASFGNLRTLPVDSVKIDGIFIKNIVRDEVDRIFARSIVDIAHAFKMSVTAEYVEDLETVTLLQEMGVDYLQGYYYSRPSSLANHLESQGDAKIA